MRDAHQTAHPNMSRVCVCMDGSRVCPSDHVRITKTAGRRRVCAFTHAVKTFLSLLRTCSSSSVSKSLVILHTARPWLYYEQSDNDPREVAVDG